MLHLDLLLTRHHFYATLSVKATQPPKKAIKWHCLGFMPFHIHLPDEFLFERIQWLTSWAVWRVTLQRKCYSALCASCWGIFRAALARLARLQTDFSSPRGVHNLKPACMSCGLRYLIFQCNHGVKKECTCGVVQPFQTAFWICKDSRWCSYQLMSWHVECPSSNRHASLIAMW